MNVLNLNPSWSVCRSHALLCVFSRENSERSVFCSVACMSIRKREHWDFIAPLRWTAFIFMELTLEAGCGSNKRSRNRPHKCPSIMLKYIGSGSPSPVGPLQPSGDNPLHYAASRPIDILA
ncbi:hypothetical protein KQX54_006624 [Cotesia glomerata]|uniref:Uncharacterized protein n=1 Tax=Cotesia glomerata TaxID=32391 RepID=A0AAV7I9M4_COTGL|nr:hypothetical protein KQX54_006624 [Cotesia glomerata]